MSAERVQGFQAQTRGIERQQGLNEARQKEVGTVHYLEGGGMEGPPAAIEREQQIQAGRQQVNAQTSGPGGDQRLQSLLRQRESELANLNRILDVVTLMSNGSRQGDAMVRRLRTECLFWNPK